MSLGLILAIILVIFLLGGFSAKNGERDSVRLYEQALKVFGMDDTSMLVISVGAEGPHVNINYAERRAVR